MQAGIQYILACKKILSYTAKLANHLIHKNGTQWLDVLDQTLKLYLPARHSDYADSRRYKKASSKHIAGRLKEKFTKS